VVGSQYAVYSAKKNKKEMEEGNMMPNREKIWGGEKIQGKI